jgi:hypothetical protein
MHKLTVTLDERVFARKTVRQTTWCSASKMVESYLTAVADSSLLREGRPALAFGSGRTEMQTQANAESTGR